MKILSLQINNFMTIGDAEIELNDRGLVLIQGQNLDDTSADSNGAGKTTLLDALCWAFYGVTSAGHKADTVINRTFGKNCRVKVVIQDDGNEYAIIRHRKHEECKNRVKVLSEKGDITRGTDKLTDEFIEKLVGSSKDVFLASVYASQENFVSLPDLSDRALKEIVEEAAGITRLTNAYLAACKNYNLHSNQHDLLLAVLTPLTSKRELIVDSINDLESLIVLWGEEQEETVAELSLGISAMQDKITELTASKALAYPLATLDGKLTDLKTELDSIKCYESAVNECTTALNDVTYKQKAFITTAKAEKQRYLRAVEQANKTLDQAGVPCSECGKPYELAELESIKANKTKAARSIADAALAAKAQAVALDDEIAAKNVALVEAKAALPDASTLLKKIERVQSLRQTLLDTQQVIATHNENIKKSMAEMDKLSTAINPHTSQYEKKQQQLTDVNVDIDNKQREISKSDANLKILDAARSVFAPKGVRNHILTAVTPFLNARTAHYLGTLSDGNLHALWQTTDLTSKGEIRDKFVITATNNLGADFFGALSGGEKRKVRLATALALQDLVASRATKNIELFIGDEIDNALDGSGLERLMGILTEKARERGTVMIISHQQLKSWITDVVTVVKENGFSTLQ